MEFVILPDSPAGSRIADRITAAAAGETDAPLTVLPHASGRPWVVGRWRADEIVHAAAGTRRVALLGPSGATPTTLTTALADARRPADFDRLARTTAGNFHLVAAVDGVVRAQGSAGASCQIYTAAVEGVTVAADRPDTLAALTGAGVAEQRLADLLLHAAPPGPLEEGSLWEGVERLPADHYLTLAPDGGCGTARWWTVPEPEVPLAEGAEAIREALRDAVEARMSASWDDGGRLSADLSGGMDSTSVCFLAASLTPDLLTYRFEAADAANDDEVWAARAARAMAGAEHRIIPRDEMPLNFAGLLEPDPDLEGPFPWIRTRTRLADQARHLATGGSRGHLSGHNGDELFYAAPAYDHTLVRSHPLRAAHIVRVGRAHRRWKLAPLLRALADNQSYGSWIAAQAQRLDTPPPPPSEPSVSWGFEVRMPPWATGDAVAETARRLRGCADAAPLHPLRAQHMALQAARRGGNALRRASRLCARYGVPWHSPYADDRVLEAALSIRFADRAAPNTYKNALATAMRGVVPDAILDRPTKGEFSADVYAGLRHHRAELLALCEDSHLARLGLIDPARLREALLAPHPKSMTMLPLLNTLGTESWLRSVAALGKPAATATATAAPRPQPVGGSR
ncbi:asparagine synthase-related protein [Streptomyces sp. BRA346]|uniref:asparagine synthase-related protein n=1 Tax=Streptomyces sp. BRA346 TaxID=2878199 RepID=UPI00406458A1